MLTPMPADFWDKVVQAVATMIFQRETSRVVGISAAVQHAVTTYTHDTRKPWHVPPADDAAS